MDDKNGDSDQQTHQCNGCTEKEQGFFENRPSCETDLQVNEPFSFELLQGFLPSEDVSTLDAEWRIVTLNVARKMNPKDNPTFLGEPVSVGSRAETTGNMGCERQVFPRIVEAETAAAQDWMVGELIEIVESGLYM